MSAVVAKPPVFGGSALEHLIFPLGFATDPHSSRLCGSALVGACGPFSLFPCHPVLLTPVPFGFVTLLYRIGK